MEYYIKQLDKVELDGECKIQVTGETNKTNFMDLNKESAQAVIEFLQRKYNINNY